MRKLGNEELGRMSVEEYKQVEKIPLVVVLDNVRSLHNIGSVFRTADAFRLEAVYLCGITATPPHREIHKTALGATDSVSWEYHEQTEALMKRLSDQGYMSYAVEQAEDSIALQDAVYEDGRKYALVFGHEIRGVEQSVVDLCDQCIEIPQYGTKHSLNISVAAGIVLWDAFNKIASPAL